MISIWIASRSAAGGYGGWAHVRIAGETAEGAAGGDRRTTSMRMLLTAALEAMASEDDKSAPVRLHSADPAFLEGARSLAAWRDAGWIEDGKPVPEQDLWAKLIEALKARPGSGFVDARTGPEAVLDFVDHWAAFALNIAKTKGDFGAPIPKPNLKALVTKLG